MRRSSWSSGRVGLPTLDHTGKHTTVTTDRIALRELLEKGSDIDLLREMIGFVAERLMALEVEGLCGAGHSERTPARMNQRNGFRERPWQTRAGTVEPKIPTKIGPSKGLSASSAVLSKPRTVFDWWRCSRCYSLLVFLAPPRRRSPSPKLLDRPLIRCDHASSWP
jgi:hypothetical protein